MTAPTFGQEATAAAKKLVLEKGTSVPNILIVAFTLAVLVGAFTSAVGEMKFRELCSLYGIVFAAWAAGGLGKSWLDQKTNGNGKPPEPLQ
jgi:hypothetical protein